MITRRQALGALAAVPVVLKTGVAAAVPTEATLPEHIVLDGHEFSRQGSLELSVHRIDENIVVTVASGPGAMGALHSQLMKNAGTPWLVDSSDPRQDLNEMQKALQLLAHTVICKTVVPDGVSVCAVTAPVALVPHPLTGEVTTVLMKEHRMKAHWSSDAVDDVRAYCGPIHADAIIGIVGEQIALQLEAEMKQAVSERGTALFAFYTMPTASKTAYSHEDFVPRRGLSMRYAEVV